MKNGSVLAILQARMSSTRLPGKVLLSVNEKPIIYWQIERIKRTRLIDKIVVATSKDQSDDVLTNYIQTIGVDVIRGSLSDVLSRFIEVIEAFPTYDTIVRLTADCPLYMAEIADNIISSFLNSDLDYASNTLIPNFPDGCDVEVFSRSALLKVFDLASTNVEKEHVTYGIYS